MDVMIPLGDLASVTLRGGRQELIFGSMRLVGPGDFTRVPHTFDGGAAFVRIGDWTITPSGPWRCRSSINTYSFNQSTLDRQPFGIFSTGPLHILPVNLDLYWLGVNNAVATFNGTSGREQRQTLGGRTWGKIGQTNLDFEVEGAGQFGSVGSGNIAAGMFTAVLGYTVPVQRLSPRVYLEFDYASGDKSAGGNVGTFNQLYPNGHSFVNGVCLSYAAGTRATPVRSMWP